MRSLRTLTTVSALSGALLLTPQLCHAEDAVKFGPHDVHSVFHVAKSENRNEVHYGLRLDAACRPVGKRPVFAYWKRHRSTGQVDAPLEGLGRHFYGASDRQNVRMDERGGHVQMHVKALERVVVDIAVQKTERGCVALPTTLINGERATLSRAYLQLGRFGLSVKYVDVMGTRPRDGARVVQRVKG